MATRLRGDPARSCCRALRFGPSHPHLTSPLQHCSSASALRSRRVCSLSGAHKITAAVRLYSRKWCRAWYGPKLPLPLFAPGGVCGLFSAYLVYRLRNRAVMPWDAHETTWVAQVGCGMVDRD